MSSRLVSVKIHKPTISSFKTSNINQEEKLIFKNLIKKYTNFDYSFNSVSINNLIFNEHCQIVSRFKEYLILDDDTEFLRRFYSRILLKKRLKKIFSFYESYSKIFPNYIILPESQYLYKNIRKKQKIIDAFNLIKKEEEENRKSLTKHKYAKISDMVIFNNQVKDAISKFKTSGISFLSKNYMESFYKSNRKNGNKDASIISISLNSNTMHNNSFIEEFTLNKQNSLKNILELLNKQKIDTNSQYEKNLTNKVLKSSSNKNKKELKIKDSNIQNREKNTKFYPTTSKILSPEPKNNTKLPNNIKLPNTNKTHKKFISHKPAISTSTNNTNTIKIINNINNIIINDTISNKEMVININTNYLDLNNGSINNYNTITANPRRENKNIKQISNKITKIDKIKSKETSLNKNKHFFLKKLNLKQSKDNPINNTYEEKQININDIPTLTQMNNNIKKSKNIYIRRPKNNNYQVQKGFTKEIKINIDDMKKVESKLMTIGIDSLSKRRKSFGKKMKKLEIGVDNINSKKPLFTNIIFNQPNQSKKVFEPINTDGNINYNSDAQTINIIHKNNVITLKNEDHIQNRLKKKIIKQKTNSVQINSKNIIFYTICNSHDCKTAKNTFSKKSHIKSNTKVNLDEAKKKTKKCIKYEKHNINKKISTREIATKYHKQREGNKYSHGSYDNSSLLLVYKKMNTLSNIFPHNPTNSITNTVTNNITNNITNNSKKTIIEFLSPFKEDDKKNSCGKKLSKLNVNKNNIFGIKNVKNEKINIKKNTKIKRPLK